MGDPGAPDCWHDDDELRAEICQGVFPNKMKVGPCVRCALVLKVLADTSIDENTRDAKLAKIKEMRQCQDCSTTSRELSLQVVDDRKLCPRCITSKGLIDAADEAVRRRLTEKTDERFKRPGPTHQPSQSGSSSGRTPHVSPSYLNSANHHRHPQPFANVSNSPLHTTDGLQAARRAIVAQHVPQFRGEHEVHVSALPVLCGKNKTVFGRNTNLMLCKATYPDYSIFSDVLEDLVKITNASWTRISETKGKDLDLSDVDFHWGGTDEAVALPRGSFSMTLRDLLKKLNADKSTYTIKDKSKNKKLGPGELVSITLSMSIMTDNFFERLRRNKGKKRLASSIIPSSSIRASKSALPRSVFASSLSQNPSNIMAPVKYILADVDISPSLDLDAFHVILSFDDSPDDAKIGHGLISQQEVRRFSSNSSSYVVKRFYDIGKGPGKVTADDNWDAVGAEVYYILLGENLLQEFYEVARSNSADVYRLLSFTPVEVLKDIDSSQVWTREPLRAKRVTKISGTLSHPEPDRLPAETVYAFVHWVYEFSKGEIVFADMQMSIGHVAGEDGYHIFDPMVHALSPVVSGVGDCGKDGIERWEQQHQCIDLCRQMGLGKIPFRTSGNDEQEDDSEGEVDTSATQRKTSTASSSRRSTRNTPA